MKLVKKVIAAAAALAMTMTSMTGVLAANTVEGDAAYVNKTVYKVTLPTTNGMSFSLDPQGLLTSTEGIVTSAGVMVAKNESSVDVTFSAEFYVECATSTSVVASTDGDVASSATSTTEAVALQIAVDDSNASTAVSASTTPAALATVVASSTKTDVTSTSSAAASAIADVALTKATYVVTGDAVNGFEYVKDPATDDATFVYMAITGLVNKNADWSAYSKGEKTIKLNAVFGFKNADGEEIGGVTITKDNASIAWTDRTQPFTFTIDTASFGGTAISDIGVKKGQTIYDYANSWGGVSLLKTKSMVSISGNTVTLDSTLAQYVPSGSKIWFRMDGNTTDNSKTIAIN